MTQTAVSREMQRQIITRLDEIVREEQITILFAIESGSRAWGFHSPDSDYDVRFVYARPRDWHYRLQKRRDVIERPIDDELDLSGWELSKVLTLALSSNAVIAEWLQSPIVYRADSDAVDKLLDFTARALDRRSVTWHYLSLIKRQQARLTGPEGGIRIKRYFYVLRPALALRWMRLHSAPMPPMDMTQLRNGCDLAEDATQALDRLTILKMAARERADTHAADPLLDQLVAEEVELAHDWLTSSDTSNDRNLWDEANALHLALSP